MPQQKRGLGKGLGALIPAAPAVPEPRESAHGAGHADHGGHADGGQADRARADRGHAEHQGQPQPTAAAATGGAYYDELPIAAVTPNPRQPRQVFDEDALGDLANSIREVGLLQPVVVRVVLPGHYELVMGERRWRASQLAGLDHIPAIIRGTSDEELLREALMENLHREQLNPLEEGAAYQQLLDDFGATHEELARKVGRSRPHISNTIRLLQLPPPVQRRVAAGVLSAGHARALLSLADSGAQDRLAHRIVAEGLSVRAVEEIVAMGGERQPEPRRARASQITAPGLTDLANRLSDVFDTRVKVELGKRKGRIVVEFASLDDLQRIVATMSTSSAPPEGAA